MDHTLLDHRLPLKDFFHDTTIERMAAPLRVLHSDSGQYFLVAGIRFVSALKAWRTLRGIDRTPCGAPHHMLMPRGQSAQCHTVIQQNTLGCAHGSQLPLQQALVASVLLEVMPQQILLEYVEIRTIQKKVVLDADNLLTRGYAIAARGKDDEGSQKHLQKMGLPILGTTTTHVHDWMCSKQQTTAAPLIPIIDAVIAGLEQRFPALHEEAPQ